jgi:hypothetical protein
MSEGRRAAIEAALHGQMFKGSPLQLKNPAELAEQIERVVADFERTREPTDAEAEALYESLNGSFTLPYAVAGWNYRAQFEKDKFRAALWAARDVKENTE